jgi:site-specific recombinase XerD
MPLMNLDKLCDGLGGDWPGFLRDWDRSLRAANHPETTRYNYLLAAAQFARCLAEFFPDPAADDAAVDPAPVRRAHVESFQTWMIETRSASTAVNKHKALQQFFKWLLTEQKIDRSPMDRVAQPKTPQKLIPVMRDDDAVEFPPQRVRPQVTHERPRRARVAAVAGSGLFRSGLDPVDLGGAVTEAAQFMLQPVGPAARALKIDAYASRWSAVVRL